MDPAAPFPVMLGEGPVVSMVGGCRKRRRGKALGATRGPFGGKDGRGSAHVPGCSKEAQSMHAEFPHGNGQLSEGMMSHGSLAILRTTWTRGPTSMRMDADTPCHPGP